MKKRLLTALLAALLTFSLAACQKGGGKVDIPASQTGGEDFQKNLHQTQREVGLPTFLETDTGYYIGWGSLYFLEKDTIKATVVCAKPDCDHTDSTVCNAMIDANYLLTLGDRIYYVGNGNDPKRVGAVNYCENK